MKLFCITLFVLVHISMAARLQAAEKPEALLAESAKVDRDRILVHRPVPVLTETTREDPLEELFETDPSIESDPSVLLDPDQPYPNINHFVTPTPVPAKKGPTTLVPKGPISHPRPDVAAPPTLGRFLGTSGRETDAFRQKCFTCCKVTKDIFKPWKNSPTHACNVCRLNKDLAPKKSGKCMEGMYLGRYDAPTDCFFERCHQMLLDRTNSCMCFWDNRSSRSGGAALAR